MPVDDVAFRVDFIGQMLANQLLLVAGDFEYSAKVVEKLQRTVAVIYRQGYRKFFS